MAQRLKKFKVRKVSLVGWGANNEPISFKKSADTPELLIFKSADYDNNTDIGTDIDIDSNDTNNPLTNNSGVNTMVDTKLRKEDSPPETEEEKKKREEAEAKAKAESEAAQKSAHVKKEGEAPAETEEEKKKREEEEAKKRAESQTEKSAVSASIIKEIRKAVDEATLPLKKENEDLRRALDGEQAIRETREFISKASKDFPNLGNPAEVGVLLMSIQKSNMPENEKEKIYSIFKQSNVANNYLFKSSGLSGPAPAKESAAAEINTKAQELIQKDNKITDLASARVEIRRMYPELAMREKQESKGVA